MELNGITDVQLANRVDAYRREIDELNTSILAKKQKFQAHQLTDEEFKQLTEESGRLFVAQWLLEKVEEEQARRQQQQQ
ncbi:unnamed protein product [Rotaria sordida]|uniref:Uncharacterized protein n=1 Tax=Rotaria sordida TaxID=392033 RepID=A0A814I0B4_9BILA|nr:unnamed protein product [Rotaria sordida]